MTHFRSQASITSTVTRLMAGQQKNHGSTLGTGKRFFSKSKCTDEVWGTANLLLNWNSGFFPHTGKTDEAWMWPLTSTQWQGQVWV